MKKLATLLFATILLWGCQEKEENYELSILGDWYCSYGESGELKLAFNGLRVQLENIDVTGVDKHRGWRNAGGTYSVEGDKVLFDFTFDNMPEPWNELITKTFISGKIGRSQPYDHLYLIIKIEEDKGGKIKEIEKTFYRWDYHRMIELRKMKEEWEKEKGKTEQD